MSKVITIENRETGEKVRAYPHANSDNWINADNCSTKYSPKEWKEK